MALCPWIERVTKPLAFKDSAMRSWLTMPVMGMVLLPGTRVMSLMVVLPTTPALAVERVRVTLPNATVMTDGFGMYANPLRFGSPALAELLIMTLVTLNPFKPLRPLYVLEELKSILTTGSFPSCRLVLPVNAVVTSSCVIIAVAKSVTWSRFAIVRFKFSTLALDCGCKAWIFGMGIYNIGVGPNVPLVTRYEEAVNGSSVGV